MNRTKRTNETELVRMHNVILEIFIIYIYI